MFLISAFHLAFAICGWRWQNDVHEIKYSVCVSEKFSTWVWRLPFAVKVNLNLSNREVKHHVKRQRQICTTWPSFLFTCRLFDYFYTKISSFMPFFIHKNCFELFLSAHFIFWEVLNLSLTFAVYVKRDTQKETASVQNEVLAMQTRHSEVFFH